MLLYFPGQIASEDLYGGVLHTSAQWLVANGVDELFDLQISMVGWREGQQCYVCDASGTLSPVIFDRLVEDGGNPAVLWAPRCGPRVYTLPTPWVQPGQAPVGRNSAGRA